jgi:hypothetical protein
LSKKRVKYIQLLSTDKYMPIEESEPVIQTTEDNPYYSILIKCDICDLHLYYNRVFNKMDSLQIKNSVVVCPSCTRNIAISDLKALSTDD